MGKIIRIILRAYLYNGRRYYWRDFSTVISPETTSKNKKMVVEYVISDNNLRRVYVYCRYCILKRKVFLPTVKIDMRLMKPSNM